jgi:Sigma-70 region 2
MRSPSSIARHGPMVWGVCRWLLPDRYAAADAFQATFLVLVRRASAVRGDDSLGPRLYGVSRRVAARARATSLRRSVRETGGVEGVAGPALDPDRAERLAILDEEIGRLPERQHAAVVLATWRLCLTRRRRAGAAARSERSRAACPAGGSGCATVWRGAGSLRPPQRSGPRRPAELRPRCPRRSSSIRPGS